MIVKNSKNISRTLSGVVGIVGSAREVPYSDFLNVARQKLSLQILFGSR